MGTIAEYRYKQWADRFFIDRPMLKVPPEDMREILTRVGKMVCPAFRIDDANRFVYENIALWCNGDPSAKCMSPDGSSVVDIDIYKGIYLAGPTGTGKSVCLDVMRIYTDLIGQTYCKEKMRWATYRSDAICEDYARNGNLSKFCDEKVLCIQDLAAEPTETLYMGNRRRVLKSILENRGDDPTKITIVSSNRKIDTLAFSNEKREKMEIYGDRVQSRAYTMFNYFILEGKDRRMP